MTLLASLNTALDKVETRNRGRLALRAVTLGTTTIATVAVGMAVGANKAAGCCSNCCWGYHGYQCDSCPYTVTTSWSCVNNCGRTCNCPDCFTGPGGDWLGHCNLRCQDCFSPAP